MDQSESSPGRDARVTLRELTLETVGAICDLKVAPQQERFVASNARSIAQAHFAGDQAWFRAVYADETPVGFVLLWDDPASAEYRLWRFMIDARYQGLGFGRRALEQLIEYVKTRPGASVLVTSYVPGDGSPGPFYERLGFVASGEQHHGELVLQRML